MTTAVTTAAVTAAVLLAGCSTSNTAGRHRVPDRARTPAAAAIGFDRAFARRKPGNALPYSCMTGEQFWQSGGAGGRLTRVTTKSRRDHGRLLVTVVKHYGPNEAFESGYFVRHDRRGFCVTGGADAEPVQHRH